jgi:steroid 5-alpha reductase family enzyme
MTRPSLLVLVGWAGLAVVMALVWARQRRTGNAGWVDVAWTFGLAGFALLFAAFADGWGPRRALVAALVLVWALRLGLHVTRRVSKGPEDGRYRALRERLGPRTQPWLFAFFQAQAAIAAVLSLAYLAPMRKVDPEWTLVDGLGVLAWLVGAVGESVADRQLSRWIADPENRGRTCRAGLWRLSRHPNYFFDWVHWFGYAILALGAPDGWTAWIAPPLMLLLFLRVTGVPPAEAQALRSRGDDYRRYQRATNAFFPGPPRPEGA